MTTLSGITKVYRLLIRMYPRPYQKEFAEEMFLDFSDLAADAGQKGSWALACFCLRELIDFPINLLRAHSSGGHMTPVFHSGPARGAFQGAVALGLACAAMMSIMNWMIITVTSGGWLFFMRIANSQGWYLDYNETAQLIINLSASLIGALLAGFLLALCFHELPRLKHYLLFGILGWAIPLAFVRLVLVPLLGNLLETNGETHFDTVLQYGWIVMTGLALGAVFSLIVQDRKKTPWLLLAGTLGYLLVGSSTKWILLLLQWILLPFRSYLSGPAAWTDLAIIIVMNGITGILLGVLLGAISGWSGRNAAAA